MKGIKNVESIKELISKKVEEVRVDRNVRVREEFHNELDDV